MKTLNVLLAEDNDADVMFFRETVRDIKGIGVALEVANKLVGAIEIAKKIEFDVEGVTRMQTTLHELLTYSRVGSTEQKDEQVNLVLVVEEAMDNLREAIADSDAVIPEEELPEVVGDQTQFLQLFQNLIGNGIKFSASKASPAISVRAYRSGKDFTVEIQDNGIGILPEYFDRIFTLFQRLHHRDEFSGNGIGLSICKKIVLRHGGRIWVESIYGEGATFKFTLPASPLS